MNGYGYGMDSGGFGWIGMLLFMVVIIVGLVVLVRALNPGSHGGHAGSVYDTDRTLQIKSFQALGGWRSRRLPGE